MVRFGGEPVGEYACEVYAQSLETFDDMTRLDALLSQYVKVFRGADPAVREQAVDRMLPWVNALFEAAPSIAARVRNQNEYDDTASIVDRWTNYMSYYMRITSPALLPEAPAQVPA